MRLVRLSDVKSTVNVTANTDDNELERVALAAEALVIGECRPILATTVVTDPLDVSRSGVVLLPDSPVNRVLSVTQLGGAGLPFTARRSSGEVFVRSREPVIVTYTVGVATVPDDVREAALICVAHLWESQRGRRTTPSRFAADVVPDLPAGFAFPAAARDLLRPYLRPKGQAA